MTQLRRMLAGYQDIDARPLVLLATLPDEPHTLPLQMVALYLVALGAKPRLLGGSTPPTEIATSARLLGADVVGVTVTATTNREKARTHVQTLRSALHPRLPLWLGGGGATALGINDKDIRVLTSWTAIDQAIALHRAKPTL